MEVEIVRENDKRMREMIICTHYTYVLINRPHVSLCLSTKREFYTKLFKIKEILVI